MKNLSIIAAIGENNELGKDNKLIWYLKEDLKFFRDNTMHKAIVMGRNTFESLPGVLKGRKHIVLTTKECIYPDGVIVCHSYEEAMSYISSCDEEVYVIGGSQIYSLFIDDVDKMLLTEVCGKEETADAYFPNFKKEEWNREVLCDHEDNGIKYSHVKYLRKGAKK